MIWRLSITTICLAVLIFYMVVVFGSDFFAPHWYALFVSILGGMVLGLGMTLLWIKELFRFFRLAGNTPDPETIDDALIRKAMNAPIAMAIIDFLSWAIAGSAFGFYLIEAHPEQTQRMIVHGLISNLYAGVLAGISHIYAFEQIMGRHLWPYLLQGRRVSAISGVVPVPTYVRVGLLILTGSVMPSLFIWQIERVGDGSGIILLLTIAVTIGASTFQGAGLLYSISRPLGLMVGRFERLRRDEPVSPTRIYRADAIGRFAEMFDDLVATIRERDFIRTTFGRYMSQQVVDRILEGEVELGGHRYDATVLFADIRGFTSLSESIPPEEVVDFLNSYLEHMVQAITMHDGIPDKFIGDGILAIWGVPMEQPDHPDKAVLAAVEMMRALDTFNAERGGTPVKIGIGLHSGDLIAGNIGSRKKMEFTVIGDTVNTCSRVEALNKELGTTLAVTDTVYQRLAPPQQALFTGSHEVTLRGRTSTTRVHTR